MTSLYRLDCSAQQIADYFGAEQGDDPWAGGYATPGRFAPVIIRDRKRIRRIVPRLWGVPPPPNATDAGERLIAHARNLESPFWIGSLRHTEYRCLIPATSFQLWSENTDAQTGRHRSHWFSLPASPLFAFAALWRDSEVPGFALISTEPNRLVSAVRSSAMPLILHAEHYEAWLDADWKTAQRLVSPFPSQLMESRAASPRAGEGEPISG
jgi:putative SOS response-associated peptidase YedK